MRTRIILSILLVTILFSGCKNKKSIDNLEVVSPVVVDESFKVVLNVIVKKDDDFALFYTEDGTVNFHKIKPIWQGVKGSESQQDVTFILPDDVYPTQFRFDLGLRKDQDNIVIEGVKMTKKGKTFEAYGTKFFEFFRVDETLCSVDLATGTITAILKDGSDTKTACIYPQQDILGPELNKLN
jgi:hypothetical protein